ncbi:hypothetical protein CA601_32785 [Paraburkholderia hospita]|nr:hypothetical protein CA601_32785 [Paraburkholderia hospita]
MAGYSVETATSALRGRLVKMSIWAMCAIAGKVYRSHRTVDHDLLHAASRTFCIDQLVRGFVRQHGSVELKRLLLARAAKPRR